MEIAAWSKNKITRFIKICTKLGVQNAVSLEEIYRKCTIQRCKVVLNDESHPLNTSYNMLPSGRRLRSLKGRTARYTKSFVPSSVRLLNALKLNLYNS